MTVIDSDEEIDLSVDSYTVGPTPTEPNDFKLDGTAVYMPVITVNFKRNIDIFYKHNKKLKVRYNQYQTNLM